MALIAARLSNTVRQRPRWQLTAAAGLAMFLFLAAAAFAWEYRQLPAPQPTAPSRATARVYIHHPNFSYLPAWQEIHAQSKSDVRGHLEAAAEHYGGMTVVSISLGELPRETIVPMVNLVASAYAQCCRSQWKIETEQACSATEAKLREAQLALQAADARLQSLRQRQEERTAAAGTKSQRSTPAFVENPQQMEVARRLAELEEKRRVLLFERTPLHPSVQELDMRIGEARREMSSMPERIAQSPNSVQDTSALPPVAPEEWESARQSLAAAQARLKESETAARAAMVTRSADLRIEVESASALPAVVVPQRFSPGMLGAALLTAATSVIGLGMITYGASLEPALSSVGELQDQLPVPVIGVLPAVHASQIARPRARRNLVRLVAVVAGSLLLLVVGWYFFHT